MSISPQGAGPGGGSPDESAAPAGSGNLVWKASPRWAAIKGNGKLEGE